MSKSENERQREREEDSSILKKLVGTGRDLLQNEEVIRQLLPDLSLPKEVVKYVMKSTDKARTEIVRIVGAEFKEFLDKINVTDEILKVLSSISLEVKGEIRFKRTDIDEEDGSITTSPEVKGSVKVKKSTKTGNKKK